MSISSLATSRPPFDRPAATEGPKPLEVVRAAPDNTRRAGSAKSAADADALSPELAQSWLTWQCRMVAGLIRGAIFVPAGTDSVGPRIAAWPDEGEGDPHLENAATEALAEGRGVLHSREQYGPGDQRTCDLIACPLHAENRTVGVAAVMISARSRSQQQAVLQLLQWGGLWIQTLVQQHTVARWEVPTFATTLIAAVLPLQSVRLAAMEVVNRLADRFACERVSLGLRNGFPIALQALSHVARFDQRTQLVRGIEAAMEEALDQAETMVRPIDSCQETPVTCAHDKLRGRHGSGAICTVRLPGKSGSIGAVTLERTADRPFDKDTVAACETLAELIGPILEMKQREERPIALKGGEALLGLVAGLFGSSHRKLKFVALAAALLLAVTSFVEGEYRVTAPATIEGTVRQLLVAPQEGYIQQAEVRAGDLVKKGQPIALLDDRSLQLELKKWQSERNKVEKEYQEALAKRDRIELSVLRAQIEQLEAELRLVEDKLARTRLEAPFDGVVVSGDLSQSLGVPVETGQVLFEVAPLDSYRVVLEVDEHDVAGMEAGKSGQLVVAALPQTPFAVSVRQVVPVAVAGDGCNFFPVEATLDDQSSLLRPGMHGVAKIAMGPRKLLWIWTHALVDRFRLWFWSLGL